MFPLIFESGAQALLLHRWAHALYRAGIPILPMVIRRLTIWFCGADIHPGARIGRKVQLVHSVGIVIGREVVVGDRCHVYGNVTLGGRGGLRDDGQPQIGSDTVICIGAIVLGKIRIGSGVTIAAGSVVLDPVPDHALAAGNPAVIKTIYPKTAR